MPATCEIGVCNVTAPRAVALAGALTQGSLAKTGACLEPQVVAPDGALDSPAASELRLTQRPRPFKPAQSTPFRWSSRIS